MPWRLEMMKIGDEQVTVEETTDGWQWRSQGCPFCAQRRAQSRPVYCGPAARVLCMGQQRAGLPGREQECQANGTPACLFL